MTTRLLLIVAILALAGCEPAAPSNRTVRLYDSDGEVIQEWRHVRSKLLSGCNFYDENGDYVDFAFGRNSDWAIVLTTDDRDLFLPPDAE